MKPIYVPKGKAKEYGDYAINIYTGMLLLFCAGCLTQKKR